MVNLIRNVRFGSLWSWSSKVCRLIGAAAVGAGAVFGGATAGQPNAADEPIVFDLPAQPLASAIEGYSVASGWQVIYDASLAIDRRSAPVKGKLTPAAALRTLLGGTGLIPEYMAADGVVLRPDPAASMRQAAPVEADSRVHDYFGRVQTTLKRTFCADDQVRSGAYRIAIGFWIGSSGEVTRAAPLGSTGRAEIDAAFDRAIRRVSVGLPPPAGFEQPIVILVTPDLVAQCSTAGPRQTRAAR